MAVGGGSAAHRARKWQGSGVDLVTRDDCPLQELLAGTKVLPRSFYERPPAVVAQDLLGKILVHPPCAGRIVETEAYLGLEDLAAHASRGLTGRTKVLFGPPGHVYVYLIYGMYECLNLTTEPEGTPGCVLIRAVEPLAGLEVMFRRRPRTKRITELANGPGKLSLAFDITRRHYGADATEGPLTVRYRPGEPPPPAVTGPRVGVRHCKDWPLRFFIPGNPFVSRTR